MSDLASVIIGNPDDSARTPQWREGVVTQVSPLLVRVGSATTAQPCVGLSSYLPRVGDAVSVLVLSGDRLALGTSSAAPSGGQTALGVVAYGAPLANPVAVPLGGTPFTALTSTITVATTLNRRYRAVFAARAFQTVGANGPSVLRAAFFPSAAALAAGTPGLADHFFQGNLPYGSVNLTIVFNGSGGTNTYIAGGNGFAWQAGATRFDVWPTEFYIEDVGPVR